MASTLRPTCWARGPPDARSEGSGRARTGNSSTSGAFRRRYRLIFAGGASFGLIVDESEVTESLRRLYGHLLPGGTLLIEIETPRYVEQDTKRPDMSRDGGLAPMGRRSSCARVTGTTARLEL